MADEESAGEQVQASAVDVDPSHPVKAYLGLALAQLNEFYTQYHREEAEKQNCKPATETEIHLQGNQVMNFRSCMLSFDARCWIPQRSQSHDNYLDFTARLPESGGKMIDKLYVNAGGQVWIDINEYWLVRCILELTMGEGEWTMQSLNEGCQVAAADMAHPHGHQDRQGRPLTKGQQPTLDVPPQNSGGLAAFVAGSTVGTAYRKKFGVYNQENQNADNTPDPWYTEKLQFGNQVTRTAEYPLGDSRRRADRVPVPFLGCSREGADDAYLMPALADGSRYPWPEDAETLQQQGCEGYPRPGLETTRVGSDAHRPRRPVYEQHSGTFKLTNLYTVFNQMYPAVADLSMLNQVTISIKWRTGHCCPVSKVRDVMRLQMQDSRTLVGKAYTNTPQYVQNATVPIGVLDAKLPNQDGIAANQQLKLGDYYVPSNGAPFNDDDDTAGSGDLYTRSRELYFAFGNDNLFCDPGSLEDTLYAHPDRPQYEFHSFYDRVPIKSTYNKHKTRDYPPTPTFEVFNIALNYETISMDSPLYTKQIEQLQQQGALEYQFRNYYTHGSQHQHATTTQHHTQCLTRVYSVLQPMEHDIAAPPVQMKDNPGDKTTNSMPPTMARSHRFSNMNIDSWQHEINQTKFPDFRVKPSDTYHLFFDGTATNTSLVRNMRDFLDYKFVQCTRLCFPHGNDRSLDGLDIRGISPQIRLYTFMNGREYMEPVDACGITPQCINALNLVPKLGAVSKKMIMNTSTHKNPQDQLWRYGEFYAAEPQNELNAENNPYTYEQTYDRNISNTNKSANVEGAQPLSGFMNNYSDFASVMKGKFVRPVTYPNGVYARMVLESKSTLRIGTGRQAMVIP